jgi:hypothetical protein
MNIKNLIKWLNLYWLYILIAVYIFIVFRPINIEYFQDAESYTVILIEPRLSMQPALEFVTKNVLVNLPTEWSLIIFPGEENIQAVKVFVDGLPPEQKARASIKDIHLTNMNITAYNELMISPTILNEIPTEVFLVVQTDSMICPEGASLLPKFMKYDYVGAPWAEWRTVGNGGFSLRRKSAMLNILDKCHNIKNNEDGFFSAGCEGARPYKPSVEEAEAFSVETLFNGKQTFGVHKSWPYLHDRTSELEGMCTGYSELIRLNS